MLVAKTDIAPLIDILNDAQPKSAEESYFYEMFHRFGVGRTVNLTMRTENQQYILWCTDGEAIMQFFKMDSADKLSFNRDGATWSIYQSRGYVRNADKRNERDGRDFAHPADKRNERDGRDFTRNNSGSEQARASNNRPAPVKHDVRSNDEKPRYKPKQTYKQKQRLERENKGSIQRDMSSDTKHLRGKNDNSVIPPLTSAEIASIESQLK